MAIEDLYTSDRHSEGAEMQVYNEFNEPIDLFITLAGQDSEIWQKATRENQKKQLQRLFNKDESVTDDDIELMVNASLNWRGDSLDGLVFSKDAVRQLYRKAPYVHDQAVLFVNNRGNFTKS